MMFMSEEYKRINKMYSELQDLYTGRRILESAMHKNFYNRVEYDHLYKKLQDQLEKIKAKKEELKKAKKEYEESRKNI